jgi:hypothetical protein
VTDELGALMCVDCSRSTEGKICTICGTSLCNECHSRHDGLCRYHYLEEQDSGDPDDAGFSEVLDLLNETIEEDSIDGI